MTSRTFFSAACGASHAAIEHLDIVVTARLASAASELRFLGLVNGLLGGVRIAAAYDDDDDDRIVEFIVLDA